jgi:hypothetical protein
MSEVAGWVEQPFRPLCTVLALLDEAGPGDGIGVAREAVLAHEPRPDFPAEALALARQARVRRSV